MRGLECSILGGAYLRKGVSTVGAGGLEPAVGRAELQEVFWVEAGLKKSQLWSGKLQHLEELVVADSSALGLCACLAWFLISVGN